MKKLTLTAASILSVLAVSATQAASLDVHGDIKINGETVINADGEYVGQLPTAEAPVQSNTIDLFKYLTADSGSITVMQDTYYESKHDRSKLPVDADLDGNYITTVRTITNTWADGGALESSIYLDSQSDEQLLTVDIKQSLSEIVTVTKSAHTTSWAPVEGDVGSTGGASCESSTEFDLVTSLKDSGKVTLGTAFNYFSIGTATSKCEGQDEYVRTYAGTMTIVPIAKIDEVTVEAGTFTDCIVVNMDYSGDTKRFMTACMGVGEVKAIEYQGNMVVSKPELISLTKNN